MEHKFESTYFKSDKKKQTQGPQARSYEWGDKNSHLFFVAIDTGPTYYQYSNYKDPARFLEAYASVPDADRCFFEQIHEGHACNEYYDIDLTLGQVADKSDILRLEQQMFIAFLNARNQYAPDYPLDTTHCRVLSASKNKKISLHIVIPTYVFENNNRHMKAFVLAFKDAWSSASDEDSALLKRIDTKVYTRNRVMRILGSCKFKDRNRPLQRAQWHEPSMNAEDQEFLITNIAAPHTRVRPIAKGSEEGKPVISRSGQNAKIRVEDAARLPQSVVDAIQAMFLKQKYASQFEVKYDGKGMLFRLQRVQKGECDICCRMHESDNAFLKLGTAGRVSFHCYRSTNAASVKIGHLDFNQSVDVMATLCVQPPCGILDADTTYSEHYVKHDYLTSPCNTPFGTTANRERAHSLMIRSATGTGKTEFVKALVKANKGFNFVAVACRRTLANALGPRLGFTNYQDIKESRIACDRLVIQAESLHRINTRYYGENVILILDEFSSLCEQMTSTSTMGHNHDYNNQILCEFIKGVSRVICLDADLTNRDVQLVKSLRNDVHVIHNTFKPQEGDRVVMYEKKSSLVSKIVDLLHRGNRVCISSTLSAERTETLHRQLSQEGKFRGQCVTSLTNDKDKRAISENINTIIASHNYFIHTPTISVGIDCNVEQCVDYVVASSAPRARSM